MGVKGFRQRRIMRIIKKDEFINYSEEEFKTLIKHKVNLKHVSQKELIYFTGMEKVVPAAGGELKIDRHGISWGKKKEPAGIKFPDDKFIGVNSIEYIVVDV